jgi:hypothetical protein
VNATPSFHNQSSVDTPSALSTKPLLLPPKQ